MKNFEFHITVTGISVKAFAHMCMQNQMRSLVIDNLNQRGEVVSQDFITASEFSGELTYSESLFILSAHRTTLVKLGAVILRSKIEVNAKQDPKDLPFSPASILLPNGMYHETHVSVSVPDDKLLEFFQIARRHGFHVSRDSLQNANRHRRKLGDNQQDAKFWLTGRSTSASITGLESHTNTMMAALYSVSISHKEAQYELVIHDDNRPHDDRWMGLSDELFALSA
jgi:hypothetical protein